MSRDGAVVEPQVLLVDASGDKPSFVLVTLLFPLDLMTLLGNEGALSHKISLFVVERCQGGELRQCREAVRQPIDRGVVNLDNQQLRKGHRLQCRAW